MIPNPVMYDADPGRKIGGAGLAVGVEEKEGIIHSEQSSSGQCPVHDFIMLLCGRHIVDVLRVVTAADGFPHADELLGVNIDHKSETLKREFLFYYDGRR